MIRCIAIDDEKLALDLLEDNIRQVPFLQLVGRCRNAMEAAALLQEQEADLLFLDIQMPGISGLQLLQTLLHPPMVILVTAYEQYALEGYQLNVIDYLLKPVAMDRFLKACNKALALQQFYRPAPDMVVFPPYFFVNVEYSLVKVTLSDILYIEGLKDYIKIHVASAHAPVVTRMSLKAMEERLPPADFARVHKSYIVALHRVTALKRDILLIGTREVPVGDVYKELIYEKLQHPGS